MKSRSLILSRAPLAALAVITCVLLPGLSGPAAAQQVVARVNGEPITAVDVEQRSRLMKAQAQKPPARRDVINELVDEKIKLQTAMRYRLEIPDSEVENSFAGMAGRMRANPQQFAEMLSKQGISASSLKRKIKADIAWGQLVRGKFQASLVVRDRDVAAATTGSKGPDVAFNYTLRPILLIVSQKSGPEGIEARRKEAEALRARFEGCEAGVRLARGLRDVAVKEPLTRSSSDLPPKLRELLDGMAIGKLTPPDITAQGVEVFALCDRRESKGDTGKERDAREQIFGERYTAQGKQFLQELKRAAKIEID